MNLLKAIKAFFLVLKDSSNFDKLKVKPKEKPSKFQSEHLRLLAMLQSQARFIDFLKEDIAPYSDAEVGLVARDIHKMAGKVIEEVVSIRPISSLDEGHAIVVEEGFDPNEIQLMGQVKGRAPYKGVVRHPGWKALKLQLKESESLVRKDIIHPVEVEV